MPKIGVIACLLQRIRHSVPVFIDTPFHGLPIRGDLPYPDAKEGRAGAPPAFRLARALPDALAHGFVALDADDVRTVDDAVDDRIGDGALAELGVPSRGRSGNAAVCELLLMGFP